MAVLKMPLLSGSAHGTIGKTLTFEHKKGTNYVKRYQKPPQSQTTDQIIRRNRFRTACIVWQALTAAQKNLWGHFINIGPCGINAPFNKIQLNTGYPCRETPDIPGTGYRRKIEFIIGLAKIGETPIGITESNIMQYE